MDSLLLPSGSGRGLLGYVVAGCDDTPFGLPADLVPASRSSRFLNTRRSHSFTSLRAGPYAPARFPPLFHSGGRFMINDPLVPQIKTRQPHSMNPKKASNVPLPVLDAKTSCEVCLTDEYLVYEDIRLVTKPQSGGPPIWDVDCWCGKCETFYGFRTTSQPVKNTLSTSPHNSVISAVKDQPLS